MLQWLFLPVYISPPLCIYIYSTVVGYRIYKYRRYTTCKKREKVAVIYKEEYRIFTTTPHSHLPKGLHLVSLYQGSRSPNSDRVSP